MRLRASRTLTNNASASANRRTVDACGPLQGDCTVTHREGDQLLHVRLKPFLLTRKGPGQTIADCDKFELVQPQPDKHSTSSAWIINFVGEDGVEYTVFADPANDHKGP